MGPAGAGETCWKCRMATPEILRGSLEACGDWARRQPLEQAGSGCGVIETNDWKRSDRR